MSAAAAPLPKPTESDVDEVIQKIDAALPKIHQRAENAKQSGKTPSDSFSTANFAETKAKFVELAEDQPKLDETNHDAPAPKPAKVERTPVAACRKAKPGLKFRRSG